MPMNKKPVTKAEDQIAESVAEAHRCLDTMFDAAIGKVDLPTLSTYCSQFTIAVLLEELRRRDQQRADELILWINEALEDGATAGELVWDWHAQIGRGHAPTNIGPYSAEQPAPPADARPFTAKTGDGDVEVLAVDSDTPGLVLTQAIRYGENKTIVVDLGRWTIRHATTGLLALPMPYGERPSWPLDVAHRVATELGALRVDWTLSKEDFARHREATPDLGREVLRIVRAVEDCHYCTDADHAVTAWRTTPSTEAELVTAGDGGES